VLDLLISVPDGIGFTVSIRPKSPPLKNAWKGEDAPMTAGESRGSAEFSAKEKTIHGRQRMPAKVGLFPGGVWEDAPAENRPQAAWNGVNAVIAGVAVSKVWMRQRRNARRQTRWALIVRSWRRMLTNARDASMRARESAATADPVPHERRSLIGTATVVALVSMTWLRRRRNAGGRSGNPR
jgi:hypothetical protein